MLVTMSFKITETDYPPKANAGSDMVIHLPQNSVILNGNLSTDDKGIKTYEWIKSADDKLTADMTVRKNSTSNTHLTIILKILILIKTSDYCR